MFQNVIARVAVPGCHEEHLLASSYMTARASPFVCDQRPTAATAVFLREDVLEEIGHAHWMPVIPIMLRPYFVHHLEVFGGLACVLEDGPGLMATTVLPEANGFNFIEQAPG